jgi:uncharacterized membrane protein YbaN (DUF454 family)
LAILFIIDGCCVFGAGFIGVVAPMAPATELLFYPTQLNHRARLCS